MPEYVTVGKAGEISDGEARVVDVRGRQVALFRVGDEFHAIDNTCVHRGGPPG